MKSAGEPKFSLHTILPLPILYGMYCNKGWSKGNTVLRNSVCDEERGWGAQTKEVFANNSIDSGTKASNKTNILYRPNRDQGIGLNGSIKKRNRCGVDTQGGIDTENGGCHLARSNHFSFLF